MKEFGTKNTKQVIPNSICIYLEMSFWLKGDVPITRSDEKLQLFEVSLCACE